MIYLQLFWEFAKIGLFAVGGGMATLPFLERLSERTGWFDAALITDMVAISESTPGPIGINMATYVGCEIAGVLGGIVATVGLVAPALIVVIIVSKYLEKFRGNTVVDNMFYGLRPAVTGLIAAAGIGVAFVPNECVEHHPGVQYVPLRNWRQSLYMCILYDKWLEPPVWDFIEQVVKGFRARKTAKDA